jgi:hypothetical protein
LEIKVGPVARVAKLLGKSGLPGARSPTGLYPIASSPPAVLLKAADKLPHEPERRNELAPAEEIELDREPGRAVLMEGYGGSGETGDGAT